MTDTDKHIKAIRARAEAETEYCVYAMDDVPFLLDLIEPQQKRIARLETDYDVLAADYKDLRRDNDLLRSRIAALTAPLTPQGQARQRPEVTQSMVHVWQRYGGENPRAIKAGIEALFDLLYGERNAATEGSK